MTLGETIHRLRTDRGMSQEELAEALGVSRQSVSKWENGASVPDLDKLVGMSRLFGVTLDQLVCGEARGPESETAAEEPAPARKPEPESGSGLSAGRRAAGVVLLVLGLLGQLILLFLAGLDSLVIGPLFTLPFILCGVLCLKARRRLGLWCAWAVYLPQQVYWTFATGITWYLVLATPYFTREMNYFRLFTGWVMLAVMIALTVVTARSFSGLQKRPAPGAIVLTAILWAAALLTRRIYSVFFLLFVGEDGRIMLPSLVTSLIVGLSAAAQTAALAAAVTLTLALIRGARART